MNNGAFGENFPYSNFHDLNMDWIIKIAKDFLDQYTNIQETISTGLEDLNNKATELEGLLQAWYDSHSEDIANQLADALEDLNEWYNTHQNYLDQTLAQNIALFNQSAEAKAEEVLQDIPQDYTDIDHTVKSIHKVASELFTAGSMFTESGYINTSGGEANNDNYVRSYYIPVNSARTGIILYDNMWGNNGVVNIISFYNSEKEYLSGVVADGQFQTGNITAPTNAKYVRFSTLKQYITSAQTHIEMTPNFVYQNWAMEALTLPLVEDGRLFTETGYITNGVDFYGNSAFVRTPYIPVMGGDIFYYYNLIGNNDAISIVSLFDINKTPISHIQSTGIYQTGSVQAPQKGYIMFSCNKTYIDNGTAYIRFSKNLENKYNRNLQKRRYVTKGEKLTTLGDSITRQTWASDTEKWQYELVNILGMNTTYENLGFDAKPVSGANGLCTDTVLDQLPNDSNIIVVMAGMNDWAGNVPIGAKTFDNEDTSTFFGACNVMFRGITGRRTASRVIAFGTTFACYPNRENFTDPVGFKNNLGLISLDYSNAMMESAQLNGIEHYDIGGSLCINKGNYTQYYRDSNVYVHPNAVMTAMIASFMARCMG